MLQQQRTTADRLMQLAQVYAGGQTSQLLEQTIDKALAYEAETVRRELAQVRQDLAELEAQYGQSTEDFFRLFQAGETDDRLDFIDWASLAQMAKGLEERLALLTWESVQNWLEDIRGRHPFAKMSKEEILEILRQTREDV